MFAVIAGEHLDRLCNNSRHGTRLGVFGTVFDSDEFDPQCQTCSVRVMLAEHDHLHLDGKPCTTEGISGVPGQNVKCSCGSFHH